MATSYSIWADLAGCDNLIGGNTERVVLSAADTDGENVLHSAGQFSSCHDYFQKTDPPEKEFQ